MSDIKRVGTTRRWSESTRWNGLIFLCEVPGSLDADMATQTREVFDELTASLQRAGSNTRRMLNATIYIPDPADLDVFNALWDQWIPEGCAPVRACIHANLTDPRMKVEIQLMAVAA